MVRLPEALALLALTLLLAACSERAGPGSPAPRESARPAATATVAAAATRPDAAEALRAMAPQVASQRRLPAWDAPSRIIDKQELKRKLDEIFAEEYPEEEAALDQLEYELFGLLRPGQRLLDLERAMLGEQVAGFYDSDDEEIFVVGEADMSRTELVLTLAHEYVHALQDRRFDLDRLEDSLGENSDALLAFTALVEGDATLAGLEYALAVLGTEEIRRLAQGEVGTAALMAAPRVLREIFIFPYVYGAPFVSGLISQGGWERVNEAYARLPASTEQVLHPAKYRQNERPLTVELSSQVWALAGEWQEARRNVMGEFFIRLLLEQALEPDRAAAAAEGWGGDAYALYRDGRGRALLVASLRWDTAEDESEFWLALVDFLIGGGLGQGVTEKSERWADWNGGTRHARVERGPGWIAFAIGHDAGAVRKAVRAVGEG